MTDPGPDQKIARSENPAAAPPGKINPKLIEGVTVTLEAFLGDASLTVAELMNLTRDAVLPLNAPLSQSVELRLNGVPVAKVRLDRRTLERIVRRRA